jgi:hypothetical protein
MGVDVNLTKLSIALSMALITAPAQAAQLYANGFGRSQDGTLLEASVVSNTPDQFEIDYNGNFYAHALSKLGVLKFSAYSSYDAGGRYASAGAGYSDIYTFHSDTGAEYVPFSLTSFIDGNVGFVGGGRVGVGSEFFILGKLFGGISTQRSYFRDYRIDGRFDLQLDPIDLYVSTDHSCGIELDTGKSSCLDINDYQIGDIGADYLISDDVVMHHYSNVFYVKTEVPIQISNFAYVTVLPGAPGSSAYGDFSQTVVFGGFNVSDGTSITSSTAGELQNINGILNYQSAFDLLTEKYGSPTPFVSPLIPSVPEPTTWAMMLAGFGLVGATMRRRRNVQISYA